MPAHTLELHLRLRVAPGRREEFLRFLADARPVYEAPPGIRVRLLEDRAEPQRFIELVEYADQAAFDRDQQRVATDPQMQALLKRWRALLAEPPTVEVYTDCTGEIPVSGSPAS
jgi:quinol monooxygenase YgiN